MRVLVTGGTGVIGDGLIPALQLAGAERIRVLSRHAMTDVARWERVEPYPADITEPAEVSEAAEGFDVVVHVAGIESEEPPAVTFDDVNVRGTELVVSECERAGVTKLIFVSTLGAENPSTDYQRSKREAEEIVRSFSRKWVILRPSAVYGPGDGHISELLTMIRSLPAIPVLDDGEQCIQPVWFEDFGRAVVRAIEMDQVDHLTLPVGGRKTKVISVVRALAKVTGKDPSIVRLPKTIALTGAAVAEYLGFDLPINETQLRLVLQQSCIESPQSNALVGTFGIEPFDLEESLRVLATTLPEQTPDQGIGKLRRKIFSADIRSALSADEIWELLRNDFTRMMPIAFHREPDSSTPIEEGATLSAQLGTGRTIQVRVEQLEPRKITLVTVKGHPLAGAVRFITEPRSGGATVRIEVYARPSDLPHWIAMKAGSDELQSGMWEQTIRNVVAASEGDAPDGIQSDEQTLDDGRGILIEEWIDRIVNARKREAGAITPNQEQSEG